MISNERLGKYLSSLRPHAATVARRNQKYHIPIVFTNKTDVDDTTDINDKAAAMDPLTDKRYVLIHNTNQYRYNGRWYSYRYSVENSKETFGILKVNDFLIDNLINKERKKTFIGRIDRLALQGLVKPFMLFVNHRFVNWDNIEVLYDCDDVWLILRDKRYNYFALQDAEINIVILPFRCEYFGEESDDLFSLYYTALNEYLQKTSEIIDGELYIYSPTMDTEYIYNGMAMNVGGWLYSQIKKYALGILSRDRVDKLRNIIIYKNTVNSNGVITESLSTHYNGLDKDVPTNKALYDSLYHLPLSEYDNYHEFAFDADGTASPNGNYKIKIMDTDLILKKNEHTERGASFFYDLSDIDNLLFRENYLIFINGEFAPDYKILGTINNITYYENTGTDQISIYVVYHKLSDHVIRNSDKFVKSYMNEHAKRYLETLYHVNYTKRMGLDAITVDDHIIQNIDANINSDSFQFNPTNAPDNRVEKLTPNNDSIKILRRKLVDAFVQDSDMIFRGIDAYYLDQEFAFVPSISDYVIFINDVRNDSIEIVNKAIEPLDFDFTNSKTFEENIKDSIDKIVEYDPSLLNGAYHTYIDSKVFTGSQANESLIYTFMYENKRGLKVPRKRYKNHETYFMMFLNGELYENYYRTLCYPNFFFIPVDDGFSFTDTDRIEILYFKNVNNNEIRFGMSDWLVDQFTTSNQDPNFYNVSVFKPFIKAEELQIFAHYPKDMLLYSSVITEASENIAFNVSYRDDSNNLCIRKDALTNIATTNTDTENAFVATSKYKFIYQRLYVDQKTYRIQLDKRFRYCDNQRQYLLFVNGRRMKQDAFLVTIPKHTRPFNGLYLYTARFVNPEDRIEIFYLPYEMTDLNIDNSPKCQLKSSGYFEYDRTDIDVPLSKDLYLFFINGKKIPSTDIIDIDSNTVRVTVNTNTLKYPAVTAINTDTIPEVTAYLHNQDKLSKYDSLVNFIKTHNKDVYGGLDKLFGYYTQMTDGEEDKVWANVAKIAILNEIVRDFWVTSGYDYQKQLFVYDYEKDEIYEKSQDGALILPALDATQDINITKNEIGLLYLYTDPDRLLFELGSTTSRFKFMWEYSQRLNQGWRIISQSINGIDIPVGDREYEVSESLHNVSKNYKFEANTGQSIITKNIQLQFVNGIYWGTIDEDDITEGINLINLIKRLDKHLLPSANIRLNGYIISNNNYFIFACPKRLACDDNHEYTDFIFPNPYNEDIVAHCRDDKTTPIYTNGEFNSDDHLMTKIYSMGMECMGTCSFTNNYGYTEDYIVWKSNGFFTRLFENYGIDIRIKIGKESNDVFTIFTGNNEIHNIDYINGIEAERTIPYTEGTDNMETPNTETRGTAANANTLPESNAASIKRVNTNNSSSSTNTVTLGSNVDAERTKELLSQGIFLI